MQQAKSNQKITPNTQKSKKTKQLPNAACCKHLKNCQKLQKIRIKLNFKMQFNQLLDWPNLLECKYIM